MVSDKQTQKSGDHSTSLQARGDINIGLSYADARQIALDVFKANFLQLAGMAKQVAFERAEEITEKFLKNLKERNPQGIHKAQNPDFQYSLFTMQKGFARTGDKETGDVLVDLLVDISKENNRTLRQIVLEECLQTAPKLTGVQLATLSTIWVLRYTKYVEMDTLETLRQYINARLAPFVSSLSVNAPIYQHLEYTGCGSISIGSARIEKIYRNLYPGLFSTGFTKDAVENGFKECVDKIRPFIRPCLHDRTSLQLNFIDKEDLEHAAEQAGLSKDQIGRLTGLMMDHVMDQNQIRSILLDIHPQMKRLFAVWEGSPMKNTSLTSVGIAIGHANARRVTGETASLSTWIR